jgi:hypothetical protein
MPDMRGDFGLCPDYPLKIGIPAHKPRPQELPGDSLSIGSVVSVVTAHVVGAFLTVVLFVIEFIGVDIVAFVMVLTGLQIIVSLAFVVVLETVFFVIGNFVTEIMLAFIGLGVIVTVMEAVLLAFVIITAPSGPDIWRTTPSSSARSSRTSIVTSRSSSASDATGNNAKQASTMLAINNFSSFIALLHSILAGHPTARSSLSYGHANPKGSIAIVMFKPGQQLSTVWCGCNQR